MREESFPAQTISPLSFPLFFSIANLIIWSSSYDENEMESSQKKRFIAYDAYEQLADAYAEQVDTKPHNAYLKRPATLSLLPDVRGMHVLDAGCGPGSKSEWLVKHGARVTAVDASPKMVEHAKKRLGDAADIRLHDLQEPLSFLDDDTIDLVIAPLVMDYIENWVPVFREFRRILRKNGGLVFSVGHPFVDFLAKDAADYFKTEKVEMWWKTWGTPILMPSYRRPLDAITEALHEAGFLIERLIEARPTIDYQKADPEGYEKVSKRPSFINIRAVKLLKE